MESEIVLHTKDFDLAQTLDCGQCFRYNVVSKNKYIGVANIYPVILEQNDNQLIIKSTNSDEKFWKNYFDLDRDYAKIKKRLSTKKVLKEAISTSGGIHILKQDLWETIISFIISANNNIPRIKGIIGRLCELCGDEVVFEGQKFYTFPTPEQILGRDLSPIRAGFRAKYITELARQVMIGEVKLDGKINKFTLTKIKGVGEKIASCVMLFSCSDMTSFPVDVWIDKIMKEKFNLAGNTPYAYASENFGPYAGIAQQYLYNHFRNEAV